MPLREDEIGEVKEITRRIVKEEIDSAGKGLKATIKELKERLRLEIEGSKSEMHSMQEKLKELEKPERAKEPEKPKAKDFSKK